jgi:hypothetical protein
MRYLFFLISLFLTGTLFSQNNRSLYDSTFSELSSMLSTPDTYDFQRAVYLAENAYFDDHLNEETFDQAIKAYASLARNIKDSWEIVYQERDKDVAATQSAVFVLLTDSVPFLFNEAITYHSPFFYNNEDFAGQKDWSNMFVSKMLETHKGNCHSMPFLYKIIMNELGYESHLALAPNHIYIKANNKKVGWYNIELTCADFPTDAWYAASGYIHTDAIRNGIYMRALSDKESVAMTFVDLAQGYQAKFGIEDGSFIVKCCDMALEYFPKYINAMLLKAEILTELYRESNNEELFGQMTELYTNIHKLGYRKMPQQMYANWLNSLNSEESNQQIKAILNPHTK